MRTQKLLTNMATSVVSKNRQLTLLLPPNTGSFLLNGENGIETSAGAEFQFKDQVLAV